MREFETKVDGNAELRQTDKEKHQLLATPTNLPHSCLLLSTHHPVFYSIMSSSSVTYDRASDEVDIPMGNPYYTWHIKFIIDRYGNTFDVSAPTPLPTSDSDFAESDKEESNNVAVPKSFKIGIAAPKSFKIGAAGFKIKFDDKDPLPQFVEETRKRKSTKKSDKSNKKQKIDN